MSDGYEHSTCTWCGERVYYSPRQGMWMHGLHDERCRKQVGAAAFVRGVTFYAAPEYTITVEVP